MPDSTPSLTTSLDSLHYADFAAHINSKFKAYLNEATILELELTSVTESSPTPKQEQFVLIFRAPLSAPPHQQMFQLEHAQLGSGLIFMVPIAKDASSVTYEAIFNRPR